MTRWVLAAVLFACSSPRKETVDPPKPPTAIDAPAAPEDAAQPAMVPPDADLFVGYPQRLAPPSGCSVRGQWKDQPRELSFTPGGKSFANVYDLLGTNATFGGKSVFAEFTTKSLRISGFVEAKQVTVHANKPFTIADWLAPGPTAVLHFLSESEGKITFDLMLPEGVKTKKPVHADRACSDLAIDTEAKFDERDAIGAEKKRESNIVANKTVPLSLEPGKPPVAQLRYTNTEAVSILDEKDKHVRIALQVGSLNPANNVTVFGWVPASAIKSTPTGFGGSWGTGNPGGGPGLRPRKDTTFVKCSSETPIAVEANAERFTVGVVLPNLVIEVLPNKESDDFVEVRLQRAGANLRDEARWLVSRAALAGCSPAQKP